MKRDEPKTKSKKNQKIMTRKMKRQIKKKKKVMKRKIQKKNRKSQRRKRKKKRKKKMTMVFLLNYKWIAQKQGQQSPNQMLKQDQNLRTMMRTTRKINRTRWKPSLKKMMTKKRMRHQL